MSRVVIGKKITKIDKNGHGEWEVTLEGGTKVVFYSDGIGNPVTDCYIKTKEDERAKQAKQTILADNEESAKVYDPFADM